MDNTELCNRRGQIAFVGSRGSGKSSLYQCLKYPNPYVIDVPSSSVLVEEWKPFDPDSSQVAEDCRKYFDGSFSEDDAKASVEVWDICGQESLWTLQQLCITKAALFVLVLNVRNPMDAKAVPKWVQMIQAKSMGADIILAASNCEVNDVDCQDIVKNIGKLENEIVTEIQDEITSLKELKLDPLVENRIETLQKILEKRPKIFPKVFMTSAVTGKGMGDLRCAILKHIFAKQQEDVQLPHILSDTERNVLLKLYSSPPHSGKNMVMSVKEYNEIGSSLGLSYDDLEYATKALEIKGFLARVNVPSTHYDSDTTLIITDPCCFATACVLVHRDEENPQDFVNKFQKSQLVERFWPTSTRPNDWTLRCAVEDIVNNGLIRESFLPLCWQVWDVNEDDIKQVLPAMAKLGVLVEGAPKAGYDIELALSYFKNISVTKRYYLPLLLKLPNDTPQSVWPDTRPKSTIQIGLEYKFRRCVNSGLIFSILAVCKTSKPNSTVLAYWQTGLVLRVGITDIRMIWNDDVLDYSARCKIVDGERQALTMAWVTLAHYLDVTETFLSNFPGLYYQLVSPLNDYKTPKSVYQYIQECTTEPEVPLKALWVLPPLDLTLNNNHQLSISRWIHCLSGHCNIKIFGTSKDEIARLAANLEHFGFNVFQPCTDIDTSENACSIVILFLTQSYANDTSLQEDFKKAQDLAKNIIAVRFHSDVDPDLDLDDVTWHDLNSGTDNGSAYIFDSDQLESLINQCCTLAYGTGNIEPLREASEPEDHINGASSAEDIMEPAKSQESSNRKSTRKQEKKKVQFSDSADNDIANQKPSDDVEDQVKPLAACTVAAAMVGAANEHLTRTRKASSASIRAASATVRVARAVAIGDADKAIEALNDVVRIVDSASGSVKQENGYAGPGAKSKTCVIV